MFIYSIVAAAATYYVVTVERDTAQEAWVGVPTDAEVIAFARGAASLREGGPVGSASIAQHIGSRGEGGPKIEVWVNVASMG